MPVGNKFETVIRLVGDVLESILQGLMADDAGEGFFGGFLKILHKFLLTGSKEQSPMPCLVYLDQEEPTKPPDSI